MKKYYTMTVRTLAPVHIGCGEQLTKIDYIYDEISRNVYIMHPRNLFQGLQKQELLSVFEEKLICADKTFSLTRFIQAHQIPETVYSKWAKYSYPVNNVSVQNGQMEIHSFIKDAYNCPYIPGSGIKGALRTCIAYGVILREIKQFEENALNIEKSLKSANRLREQDSLLKEKIFHISDRENTFKSDIVNDCMMHLQISDSKPLSPDCLTLCQKIDVDYDGNPHSLNLVRECISPETEIVFDLAIDENFPFSVQEILGFVHNLFVDYDDLFRSKFKSEVTDTFHEPPEADEEYLYLGGGTGYPMKSILFSLYEDPERASQNAAVILETQFSKAGHQDFTERTGVSPKVWKCTRFNEQLYEMGLCTIKLEEK
ncbi:MAG: type III-A CRISPR-associated RAMP protein Csm5 [Oscillospiraceae bacterium]|nr:type III-A CRISPR-associated RAMP protein Csm5 [Oscillospiraceae bacterium]MBR1530394.1 type III-A CRISPR-associated RAMP protein Csm5 [Oscillospiraceae bacterium]